MRTGRIDLRKVAGEQNPADLLTKYTDRKVIDMALEKMNLKFLDGRSAVAPAAMGTSAQSSSSVSHTPAARPAPQKTPKGQDRQAVQRHATAL